jgi:hypothetical protein
VIELGCVSLPPCEPNISEPRVASRRATGKLDERCFASAFSFVAVGALRLAPHDSEARWFATPSSYDSFIRYIPPDLRCLRHLPITSGDLLSPMFLPSLLPISLAQLVRLQASPISLKLRLSPRLANCVELPLERQSVERLEAETRENLDAVVEFSKGRIKGPRLLLV